MFDIKDEEQVTVSSHELLRLINLVEVSSGDLFESLDLYDNDEPDEGEADTRIEVCEKLLVDQDKIGFWVPGESEGANWTIGEFLHQAPECDSLVKGKLVTLRSRNFAFQFVHPVSDRAYAVDYHDNPLPVTMDDGATVKLTRNSLLIGVYASKVGAYEKRVVGAVSGYLSVEVDFSKCVVPHSEDREAAIIEAYLFELVASHGVVFERSDFIYDAGETPTWATEAHDFKLRPLEETNEGVRLFLAAARVSDPELRFFSFYKVLEHFAPIVLNIEVHDTLQKKLLTDQALSPNGEFIRDILRISKDYDQKKNDRDLIRGVLLKGIDLVSLSNLLPVALKRTLSYDTPSKEIEQFSKELAESICTTRHQVAHAKSHYESRGSECKQADLPALTVFLEKAAAEVIRWYNRLPSHQRI